MSGGFLAHLQALADPMQQRWLWGRLGNRWSVAPEPPPPAYLHKVPDAEFPGRADFADLTPGKTETILLVLPGGETLRVAAGKIDGLMDRQWSDPAAAAAFQGFAWMVQDPDGTALATLWPAWLARHSTAEPSSLAWNADVVAERAIMLLDMAERHGLPAPRSKILTILGAHAAILLNSFTERSAPPSALARRAHALARLGLDLDMPATADFGLAALLAECGRLQLPSGIGNMESTHHHLRLCHSLADTWLAARRFGRSETPALERVLRQALAVLPLITLPGGMPLIGDVAENLPGGWLNGLLRGGDMSGWIGRLAAEDRVRIEELRDQCLLPDLEALRADGWLRLDQNGWSGLWHAVPGGWPAFDGHGHQDLGSCELHFEGVPIFVDPGGSPQGAINGQGKCRSATAHGGLQLNRRDPYPLNHPAYSDDFRRYAGGTSPRLQAEFDGAHLLFGGLAGIGGLREGSRQWHFTDDGFTLDDRLNGTGRYRLSRRLLTPLAARREDPQTVILEGSGRRFRVSADHPLNIGPGLRWAGFGVAEPLSCIEISGRINLPWRGQIRVLAF